MPTNLTKNSISVSMDSKSSTTLTNDAKSSVTITSSSKTSTDTLASAGTYYGFGAFTYSGNEVLSSTYYVVPTNTSKSTSTINNIVK